MLYRETHIWLDELAEAVVHACSVQRPVNGRVGQFVRVPERFQFSPRSLTAQSCVPHGDANGDRHCFGRKYLDDGRRRLRGEMAQQR